MSIITAEDIHPPLYNCASCFCQIVDSLTKEHTMHFYGQFNQVMNIFSLHEVKKQINLGLPLGFAKYLLLLYYF